MNQMSGNEVSTGIVPMSIKMLNQVTLEGTQIYYDQINVSVVSLIGRFVSMKREQNQIRFTLVITDDSGMMDVAYFAKQTNYDPIVKLSENGLDDLGYQKFILSAKIYKDAPYYVLQHYYATSLDEWMFHTMKIIQTEVQSRPYIDWEALKDQPLEKQIEEFIRHNKRANMQQLLKKFKCSVQQLRVQIENLKKRSAITECLNQDTFKIVK